MVQRIRHFRLPTGRAAQFLAAMAALFVVSQPARAVWVDVPAGFTQDMTRLAFIDYHRMTYESFVADEHISVRHGATNISMGYITVRKNHREFDSARKLRPLYRDFARYGRDDGGDENGFGSSGKGAAGGGGSGGGGSSPGAGGNGGGSVSAVPVPAALPLLMTALFAGATCRRRKA